MQTLDFGRHINNKQRLSLQLHFSAEQYSKMFSLTRFTYTL